MKKQLTTWKYKQILSSNQCKSLENSSRAPPSQSLMRMDVSVLYWDIGVDDSLIDGFSEQRQKRWIGFHLQFKDVNGIPIQSVSQPVSDTSTRKTEAADNRVFRPEPYSVRSGNIV